MAGRKGSAVRVPLQLATPSAGQEWPAPEHLKPATRQWYTKVVEEYLLEEHHVRLLTHAAEAWDQSEDAREAIARTGMVYMDRFSQPRARPEVAIERDAKILFARLLRELALDVSAPDGSRPPALTGRRR